MIYLPLNFTLFFWQTTELTPSIGWLDVLWLLLQTLFALALVCGLAILIFRYILPRLNAANFNRSIVRVIDGASLETRKKLMVVEVAGKYLLLAVSESGVQLIAELDGATVEEAVVKLEALKGEGNPQFKKASESLTQILDAVWRKKK